MELIHLNLRIFHLCIFIELGSHSPNLLHIFSCCLKKGAYSFFLLADNCRYLVGYDDGSYGDSSWIVRHKLLSSRWRIPRLRGARSACCKYWHHDTVDTWPLSVAVYHRLLHPLVFKFSPCSAKGNFGIKTNVDPVSPVITARLWDRGGGSQTKGKIILLVNRHLM